MKNNYEYFKDGTILRNGEKLSHWLDKHRYMITKINGVNYKWHRLIALWFIPNDDHEKKRTINHINGNKHDNRVENLEWMSFSDNAKHSWRNNLAKPRRGENHGRARLTQEQVDWVRSLPLPSKNGIGEWPSTRVAEKLGVNFAAIRRIRRGETWANDSNTN